jgi:hypothetical protein
MHQPAKEEPKILPIGKSDQEKNMIQQLFNSGFTGHSGIIGYIKMQMLRNN